MMIPADDEIRRRHRNGFLKEDKIIFIRLALNG
jgi:hypothetical protein